MKQRKEENTWENTFWITFLRASAPHTTLNSINMAPKVKDASKKPAKKTAGPSEPLPFPAHLQRFVPSHACKLNYHALQA